MVESVSVRTISGLHSLPLAPLQDYKIILDLSDIPKTELHSFDLIITFKNTISGFRNHDHTWIDNHADFIAADYSPKAIRLDNGQIVQPNLQTGIWEIQKRLPSILLWRFNPKHAAPLAAYSGNQNEKMIVQANRVFDFNVLPALLFPKSGAVEFSRSRHPFSAIACFTDHCDFDTPENLTMQREFFKVHGIKVTKGFFLNQFSKRQDNASFENAAAELTKWQDDGHELAYHSLSQSLKPDVEAFADFENFNPPFPDLPTWIDHGFQKYNLSLFRNSGMPETTFGATLKAKKIRNLWNYIDSGTSTLGVINQLNPDDFTLDRFRKGNADLPFAEKMGLMIKNTAFHFYADEQIILKYKQTAGHFKKLVYQKKGSSLLGLLRNFFGFLVPVAKVFFGWNTHKRRTYKLAKYAPLIFKHRINQEDFYIFQTLEIVDFKKALHPQNLEKLVGEKGLFIGHTYFSAMMGYHRGKMFRTPDRIDEEVASNFGVLSSHITSKAIWNPTLNELVLFLANFDQARLDIDSEGMIIVANASGLPHRTIN